MTATGNLEPKHRRGGRGVRGGQTMELKRETGPEKMGHLHSRRQEWKGVEKGRGMLKFVISKAHSDFKVEKG